MPSKPGKHKTKFSPTRQARRRARELVGTPPPSRVEQDRRHKPAKHKKKPSEDQ
jgi:DNA-directed RNA polymerase subunit K/omega